MAVNPNGAVQLYDFGNPKVVSGRVKSTAISGGQLVTVSGLGNIVSSGTDSFVTSDLTFVPEASGLSFVGVALNNAGSNSLLSVALEGVFILTAANGVSGGEPVCANGGDAVVRTAAAGFTIGRALTSAGSEGFCVVHIK